MEAMSVNVTIKRAWWVMPYLYTLLGIYRATGFYPDDQHVTAVLLRGLKLEID